MSKKCSAFAFFIGLTLASCIISESRHTIAFSGKTMPILFQAIEKCDSGRIVDFNTIGNLEIAIVDSLAVVSTSADKEAWKIISLDKDSLVAEFVDAGNGPNELNVIPLLSQASFIENLGHKVIAIPDFFGQRWHKVNIGKAASGANDSSLVVEDPDLGSNVIYNGLFGNGIEYRITVDPIGLCIKRTISINGEPLEIDSVDRLNEFTVERADQLGLLMPTVAVSPTHNKVVEIYNSYPQINLYSLSDDYAITLLPDGESADYEKYMRNNSSMAKLIYRGIKGYDDFFVINKVNGDNETELQFLTWNGIHLQSMVIPAVVTSFDIDFNNNRLLAIDYMKDEIREYELPASIK